MWLGRERGGASGGLREWLKGMQGRARPGAGRGRVGVFGMQCEMDVCTDLTIYWTK